MDVTELKLNGQTVKIGALSFGQLKKHRADIDIVRGMRGIPTDDEVDAIVRLVIAAAERVGSKVTVAEVENLIDFGNCTQAMDTLFAASGFRKEIAAAIAAGQTQAAGMTGPTSAESTQD